MCTKILYKSVYSRLTINNRLKYIKHKYNLKLLLNNIRVQDVDPNLSVHCRFNKLKIYVFLMQYIYICRQTEIINLIRKPNVKTIYRVRT